MKKDQLLTYLRIAEKGEEHLIFDLEMYYEAIEKEDIRKILRVLIQDSRAHQQRLKKLMEDI